MFVEIIDQLRCPHPHGESWLVLAADEVRDRDVVRGVLGCPVCCAEFAIVNGIARFDEVPPAPGAPASEEQAMRLAAFLDLSSAQGIAALCGIWGNHALLVRGLTETHLLLVNPPAGVPMGDGISGLTAHAALPLARGSLRGLALDAPATGALTRPATDTPASASRPHAYLDALRPGGRMLAPVELPVPRGVRELVRDESIWVGERESATESVRLTALRRGP